MHKIEDVCLSMRILKVQSCRKDLEIIRNNNSNIYNGAISKDDSGPSLTGKRLPTNRLIIYKAKINKSHGRSKN